MKSTTLNAILSPLVLLLVCSPSSAQDTPAIRDSDTTSQVKSADRDVLNSLQEEGDEVPSDESAGEIEIGPWNIELMLSAARQGSSNTQLAGKRSVFHRPFFFFAEVLEAERSSSTPAVVQSTDLLKDGRIAVEFKLFFSTPEIRQACRDYLYEKESKLYSELRADKPDLNVRRWPIKHIVLRCLDRRSGEVLGVGQTTDVREHRDWAPLFIRFTPAKFEEFIQVANVGAIEFSPLYSFRARQEQAGQVQTIGENELKEALNATLSSEQQAATGDPTKSEAPIFQGQAQEVVATLRANVESKITTNDRTLLPSLDPMGPELWTSLFLWVEKPYDGLTDGQRQQLDAYLEPHIRAFNTEMASDKHKLALSDKGTTTIDSDLQSKSSTRSSGTSIGGGGSIGYVSVQGAKQKGRSTTVSDVNSREVADTARKALEDYTGVSFREAQSGTSFVPSRVKIGSLRENALKATFSISNSVVVGLQTRSIYREASSVPMSRTERSVDEDLNVRIRAAGYGYAPIGAVLPFFGTTLPDGWRYLDDPDETFPDNAHFGDLRGKRFPELAEGTFFGATRDPAQVNIVHVPKTQTITVPGQEIAGHDAPVNGARLRVTNATITHPLIEFGNKFDDYLLTLRNPLGAGISPRAAAKAHLETLLTHLKLLETKSQVVVGSVDITRHGTARVKPVTVTPKVIAVDHNVPEHLPAHVKCRWIIRVE